MIRTVSLTTSTILCSLAFAAMSVPAVAAESDVDTLMDLSLEQLANIDVTSVSKKSEKASEAAAAIFVITQDDIRRSGMTSIPEALRMVPGLSVAQSSSHQWVITSRGFSDHFSNKLLVLIDGRSVYTPLFSGVYWDVQDTLLEDIERIEVIRGPGATLWGANAVNGVINIITKSAKDTQGGFAGATVGNQENGLVRTRYGAKIGENAYMRAYAKYDDRDRPEPINGVATNGSWNKSQAGFRSDWNGDDKHSFTLQGDAYRAGESINITVPLINAPFSSTANDREHAKGGNILGRWNYKYSAESDLSLQLYVDNARRNDNVFSDERNTFDIDFQHAWMPNPRNEVVWGTGYRLIKDHIIGSDYLQFTKSRRTDGLFNAFLQDKIALMPESVYLTLGSKFEHNDYTGSEYQPSARLSWLVDQDQTLWASVSRAVRTPNRFSEDGSIVIGVVPTVIFATTVPNPGLESEILKAYEMGYRIQPTQNVSFDLATFYNDYDRLVIGSATSAVTVMPVNGNEAYSYGFEAASQWNVSSTFELAAAYTYLNLKFDQNDQFGFSFSNKSPRHQFNVRSTWILPHNLEINNSFYFVDQLDGNNIDQYLRADIRLAWKPMENLELSIVGQNLLDPTHQEFTGYVYQTAAEIPRSIYGNIAWKF